MKRIARVSVAALLPLLLLVVFKPALGQDLPPGPTVVSRSSLPGLTMQGQFDLINIILDFEPGSATPPHTHGGPGIATVLGGEIAFGMEGQADHGSKPGEFYLDLPGTVHTASNKTTSVARVSYVVALPKGAAVTTVVGGPPSDQLPPGPKAVYRSTLPDLTLDGEFEIVNLILDFGPGAATPAHTHGGPGIVTVLQGEITFGMEGKPDMIARPGDVYPDLPGTVHTAANKSSTAARVSYVTALPKGAALTTVVGGVQAPAPQTVPAQQPTSEHGGGHAGMPRTGSPPVSPALPLLMAALALVLAGLGFAGWARLSGVRRR